MKYIVLLFSILWMTDLSAQVVEVNPNIDWKYVRTQEIELQSGRSYQFEFPAEKGYDYIVNVTHNNTNAFVSVSVTDIQHKTVDQKTDSTNFTAMDMGFRVGDNGTYLLKMLVATDKLDAKLSSTVSIVRRPIVEY